MRGDFDTKKQGKKGFNQKLFNRESIPATGKDFSDS